MVVCGMHPLNSQVLSTKDYIDAYKYAAMQEMKIYNIPASITLGQGILESASGNSKLATECNNHFGIKCRKEWTGPYCLADDDAANECFRGYGSAMESYRDHSLFLKGGQRYNSLFTLMATDYQGWANGLRAAGYATNPSYAKTLIGVIEKYRLTMYDSMVIFGEDYLSPDTAAQRVITKNGLPAVFAKAGQTPRDIAKENEMGAWQIYKYNDLKRGEQLDPGEIVYLKPKKRKGTVDVVVVKEGESMRAVSQEYGIKLKQLYKKNHLKPGQQVKPGEILTLQAKNPGTPVTVDPNQVTKPTTPVEKPVDHEVNKDENANFHEVKPGETLYSIAAKYGVTVEELKLWNNLSGSGLKTGQLLILKKGVKAVDRDTAQSHTEKEIEKSVKYHIVLRGETLYSIGKMYNVSVDSIVSWNHLLNLSIYEGQELVINNESGKKVDKTVPITYSVQPGDTLYSIARKYGLSVEALRKLNGLTTDNLTVGQTLNLQ